LLLLLVVAPEEIVRSVEVLHELALFLLLAAVLLILAYDELNDGVELLEKVVATLVQALRVEGVGLLNLVLDLKQATVLLLKSRLF